jgi:CheY-like chemotaxis protein
VRVSTGTDALGRAIIEVADTGGGIAPDVIDRIFDPFFTTHPGRGLGLGLSFAHGTVTALGGEISVESEVDEGSIVRVALPSALSQRAEPKSVLIIADEPAAGDALSRALGDGHAPEVAADAHDALSRVAAGAFDAIVCDALPPGMCVVELYAEAVRRKPQLAERFLFLIGGKVTQRARNLLDGMRPRCLEKPPDVTRLRELIRRAATGSP